MDRERILWLDIAKGFAILAVMMVHFASEYRPLTRGLTWHVNTFFAVTGLLVFMKKGRNSSGREIRKDVSSILWPYITLSVLYIVVNFCTQYFKHDIATAVSSSGKYLFQTISGAGIGTLWFLPTMFLAKITYRFLMEKEKINERVAAFLIMAVSLSLAYVMTRYGDLPKLEISWRGYLINVVRLLLQSGVAVGFMEVGRTFLLHVKKMEESSRASLLFLMCGMIFLIMDILLYKFYAGNDLHLAKIVNPVGYLGCSILGIGAIIFLSCFMSRIPKNPCVSFLKYCGKNSLIIMTTHLEYKVVAFSTLIVFSVLPNSIITQWLAYAVVCIIEVVICEIVNRTFLRNLYSFKNIRNRKA